MVPIFTYRDERRLFAVIGAIIVAGLIALVQLEFARQGRISPLAGGVTALYAYAEVAIAQAMWGTRNAADYVARLPELERENAGLRAENDGLRAKSARLEETLARVPSALALDEAKVDYPQGIAAMVIGFDPENKQQIVTIDKGRLAGVARDDGVVDNDGVVGRVVEAGEVSSKVLLLTDFTSNIPAVVQRGRWWGIATGTLRRVNLHYVSQDARLHVGDAVVTGEGRSFHAGYLIGHVASLTPMPSGALDQQAIVEPAVAFGRLDRVLVLRSK
ncbi:MAG: rod shape-determining protein MreC [Candidatus Eremiobacteraeota bacterium]|nr:rod shape-determining protein MreC [Candidatus Eremiobacteraeota bacterium]